MMPRALAPPIWSSRSASAHCWTSFAEGPAPTAPALISGRSLDRRRHPRAGLPIHVGRRPARRRGAELLEGHVAMILPQESEESLVVLGPHVEQLDQHLIVA